MILKGKTQKGKNRVRELGESWIVIAEQDQVQFSRERGPWFLIRPILSNLGDKDRWIHSKYDVDFEIVT